MKKSKQIVPLCLLVAAILFVGILVSMVKGSIEDFQNEQMNNRESVQTSEELKLQADKIVQQQQEEERKLNSIKPVMKEPSDSDGESLGTFGEAFDRIINISKESGLLLRSIEYERNPENDAIYKDFSDIYNVCELKFFFVGTYASLRSFINSMVNEYDYLVSISRLNVMAFSDNTDYLLIKMSITLYSKKPNVAN